MNTTCIFKTGCCTSEPLCCEASLWEERRHGSSEGEIPGQALLAVNPLSRRKRWCSRHEDTCEQVQTSWQNFHVCHKIMQVYPLVPVYLHPSTRCFAEIPGPLPPEVEFHGWPSAVQCFQDLHDGGSVNSIESVSMPPLLRRNLQESLSVHVQKDAKRCKGHGQPVLAARFYRR